MENNKLINYIKENGGATLDGEGKHVQLKKGFVVSLHGMEYTTKDEEEVINKVEQYKKLVANNVGLYVGLWLEGNLYYIDISIIVDDKREALEIGKANKQKSVYDIENDSYLYIKNYTFINVYTIYKVVRSKDNKIKDYKIIVQSENIKKISRILNMSEKSAYNFSKSNLMELNVANCNDRILIVDSVLVSN